MFDANREYWREGEPFVDQMIMDSSFTDENALANALRSGAIDVLPLAPFALAGSLQGGSTTLLRSVSGAFSVNLYMRVDAAPFDDVRVRQAMRLLVDRPQMVKVVFGGYGEVSNDVPGQNTPLWNPALKRERDVEQARSLLKQAGRENLTVKLQTSTALTGLQQAATLFKQQALDAGVRVDIAQVDSAAYFAPPPSGLYTVMHFAETAYYPVPSMRFVWTASFAPKGYPNETRFYTAPGYEKMLGWLKEVRATADESKLQEIWNELQRQQFDEGGYINFGVNELVDALSTRVKGLTPSKYLNASAFNFRKAWLDG